MKRLVRAVYPGSFDPITKGHIDIAERAADIFDNLKVSVLFNPQKTATFSVDERCDMVRESLSHLPNVTVDSFSGLLVDYMRKVQSRVIIRGLRAMSDFEYEFQMALMNRKLAPEIETFFIVTDPQYSFVSSSGIRDIFSFGGTTREMIPPCVYRRMVKHFNIQDDAGEPCDI